MPILILRIKQRLTLDISAHLGNDIAGDCFHGVYEAAGMARVTRPHHAMNALRCAYAKAQTDSVA